MYVRYTVHVQKGNKNIFKVVHVTSEGPLEFFEASKIHFGPKIAKITTLFSIVFFSGSFVSATAVTVDVQRCRHVIFVIGRTRKHVSSVIRQQRRERAHNRPGREDDAE